MRTRMTLLLCIVCGVALSGCGGKKDIVGKWKPVHSKTVGTPNTPLLVLPIGITFNPDGTVGGYDNGTWNMIDTPGSNNQPGPMLRFHVTFRISHVIRSATGGWDPKTDRILVFDQELERDE